MVSYSTGLPPALPSINVMIVKNKIMFNRPDLSGHKIKTMKALKISALVLFSSIILGACEKESVGPVGGSIDGPLSELKVPEYSAPEHDIAGQNGQVTRY